MVAVNKNRPTIQSYGYNGSEPTRIYSIAAKENSE